MVAQVLDIVGGKKSKRHRYVALDGAGHSPETLGNMSDHMREVPIVRVPEAGSAGSAAPTVSRRSFATTANVDGTDIEDPSAQNLSQPNQLDQPFEASV